MHLNGRLNAQVESDIVGYTTVSVGNLGYAMVALPFSDLNTTEDGYPIQSIQGTLSQHNNTLRSDALLVMNPNTKTYTTYYYKTAGWVKDGETVATTDVVPAGASVFINKKLSAGEITIAGKVMTDATVTVPLTVGLNLVANPYPAAIKVADIQGSLSAHNNQYRADSIMRMNPVTKVYTTYQLKTIGWVKEGETTVTTDTIEACEGFVFQKMVSSGSINFTRPF